MWRSCVRRRATPVTHQASQKKVTGTGPSLSSAPWRPTADRFAQASMTLDRPVYLKQSSSPRRSPSFFIPRMRDTDDAIKADKSLVSVGDGLGSSLPLFSIASSSCDYYALRLPLLKAGFKRVLSPPSGLATNLIWAKSMPFRRFKLCRKQADGSEETSYSLRFAEATTSEQQQHLDSLTMVHPLQQFNHFPLSHRNLGSKKGMANNITRAMDAITTLDGGNATRASSLYGFVPRTWFYPAQKAEIERVFREAPSSSHFIWKPSLGSCGRGICFSKGGASNAASWQRVMRRIDEKAADEENGRLFRQYVVQDYVENPLLLDGRKMDLRLYVAVTSYDPLMLYVHDEGLVRLAAAHYSDSDDLVTAAVPGAVANRDTAHDYDEDDADDSNTRSGRFKHLTNYSVGRKFGSPKHHEGQEQGQSADEPLPELKWSFDKLWTYLDSNPDRFHGAHVPLGSLPSAWVREQIALLIVRTFMAAKPVMATALQEVTTRGGYFELYGVDVMLDAQLTPWLIEINTLPSLESSSSFDYATKTNVVSDLLNVAMLEPLVRSGSTFREYHRNQNGQVASTVMSPRVQKLLVTDTRVARLTPREKQTELKATMDDAFQHARGFKRIFPPVSLPRHTSAAVAEGYPLRNDNRALRADIELFSALGTLTEKDRALLETL